MGKNRFREDALRYWDIRCEDAWGRFEEAVRENPYLTAKEFCIKDMGCVAPFMKWARRTKHSITALRRQALEERMKAKDLERRDSAEDPTPGVTGIRKCSEIGNRSTVILETRIQLHRNQECSKNGIKSAVTFDY